MLEKCTGSVMLATLQLMLMSPLIRNECDNVWFERSLMTPCFAFNHFANVKGSSLEKRSAGMFHLICDEGNKMHHQKAQRQAFWSKSSGPLCAT